MKLRHPEEALKLVSGVGDAHWGEENDALHESLGSNYVRVTPHRRMPNDFLNRR